MRLHSIFYNLNPDCFMRFTLLQWDLHRGDARSNIAAVESLLGSTGPTDVIVLPEMWGTAFDVQPSDRTAAEADLACRWMQQASADRACWILGSLPVLTDDGYRNRFYVWYAGRLAATYDKRHLFSIGDEADHYRPGRDVVFCPMESFTLRPLICYDLRFPVYSRCRGDYDLLVYVANWPASRIEAWTTLLRARAIENQCYVVGVNRTGVDGSLRYNGRSVVYGPQGEELLRMDDREQAATVELDADVVSRARERFPAWRDADRFRLE